MMLVLQKKTPDCLAVRIDGMKEREGYYVFYAVGAVEGLMHKTNIANDDWWFDQKNGAVRWRCGGELGPFTAYIGDWLVVDNGELKRFTSWKDLLREYQVKEGMA